MFVLYNLLTAYFAGDIPSIRKAFSFWADQLSDLNSFLELDQKEEAVDEIIKQLFQKSLQLRR